MENKRFLTAQDVMEMLGVSLSYSYKLLRRLDSLSDTDMKEDNKYYIAFDYVVDNQDIRNKYRMLKSMADMIL